MGNLEVEAAARSLAALSMKNLHPVSEFVPGTSPVPVTGKVFGQPEIEAALLASSDFWLTGNQHGLS